MSRRCSIVVQKGRGQVSVSEFSAHKVSSGKASQDGCRVIFLFPASSSNAVMPMCHVLFLSIHTGSGLPISPQLPPKHSSRKKSNKTLRKKSHKTLYRRGAEQANKQKTLAQLI